MLIYAILADITPVILRKAGAKDEAGTLSKVPFALMLEEFVYHGRADFALKSTKGKVSKAKLAK